MREAALLRQIRAALCKAKGPDGKFLCRVVRNTVGFDDARKIHYGLGRGSPDLVGVILAGPRRGAAFCVEVKAPGKALSTAQRAWWRAARRAGIHGGRAESADDALALLDAAIRGTDSGAHDLRARGSVSIQTQGGINAKGEY